MDTMSINDILLVGVPETLISLLFGLLLSKRLKQYKIKNRIKQVFLIITSIFFILLSEYYIRVSFQNINLTAYLVTFVYIAIFFIIWRFNFRESFLFGCASVFLFIASDVVTIPIVNRMVENNFITDIFNYRFVLSLPSRLLQLLMLLFIFKFRISFDRSILKTKWNKLTRHNRFVIYCLVLSLSLSIFLITNNSDLFIKLSQTSVDKELINLNIQFNFFATVIFMVTGICLFVISAKYIEYKEIVMKTPEEICTALGEYASPKQIEDLISILKTKLNSKEVEKDEEYS